MKRSLVHFLLLLCLLPSGHAAAQVMRGYGSPADVCDLGDVDCAGAQDGDVLLWDSIMDRWVADRLAGETDPLSLHLDGSSEMAGNLRMGGFDIDGAGTVRASGQVIVSANDDPDFPDLQFGNEAYGLMGIPTGGIGIVVDGNHVGTIAHPTHLIYSLNTTNGPALRNINARNAVTIIPDKTDLDTGVSHGDEVNELAFYAGGKDKVLIDPSTMYVNVMAQFFEELRVSTTTRDVFVVDGDCELFGGMVTGASAVGLPGSGGVDGTWPILFGYAPDVFGFGAISAFMLSEEPSSFGAVFRAAAEDGTTALGFNIQSLWNDRSFSIGDSENDTPTLPSDLVFWDYGYTAGGSTNPRWVWRIDHATSTFRGWAEQFGDGPGPGPVHGLVLGFKSATSSHGLAANDVLIAQQLEVDGDAFLDADLRVGGAFMTASGVSWDFGAYAAVPVTPTGHLTIVVDGTAYGVPAEQL